MQCTISDDDLLDVIDGEADEAKRRRIGRHLDECPRCQQRVAAIRQVDALARLEALRPVPAEAVLRTRRALAQVLDSPAPNEIMTLEEVAAFLRLTDDQMADVMVDLPAFELAGQMRVRRAALIEWITQREGDYRRESNASWIAGCMKPSSTVLGLCASATHAPQ